MRARDEEAFKDYVTAQQNEWLRTACLLCGDWHRAEDLVATTVVKLYASWRKLQHVDHPDAYVRRMLVRVYIDEKRRPWRREHPTDTVPEVVVNTTDTVVHRTDLRRLLERMPARQRAVLVLRYYEDLSVEQTAEVLGCSKGAVKTLTVRAVESIRKLLPFGVTTRWQYEEAL